ncbi:MAG: sortase [Caldilineaceae bacterium]|nr:sortase [Caldilineaceae bacterium]
MMQKINRLRWIVMLLLGVFVLAGCSTTAAQDSASSDLPNALPAGEDGVLAVAEGGPPLGRPSLGSSTSAPVRLVLPSINLETDVIPIGWHLVQQADGTQTSEWEVADYAAGWHKNSAHPGEGGNVVVSGHNNIRGAVFRKLYTMQPGDEAVVWAGGQEFTYTVEEVMVLEEKFAPYEQRINNAQWIQSFDDDRLTLVSCWPEDDNTHRVVVVAKRVGE